MNDNRTILITGSNGFIGLNLKIRLQELGYKVLEYRKKKSFKYLKNQILKSDLIFHLAGTNRSEDKKDFKRNNLELTKFICKTMIKNRKKIVIFFSSSTQVLSKQKSIYSKTKLSAEKFLKKFSKNNFNVILARLPNVYGKWSKPNYNSFVSTCCFNIARNLPVKIFDTKKKIRLIYIDDLIDQMLKKIKFNPKNLSISYFKPLKTNEISALGLYNKILNFEKDRTKINIANVSSNFASKLYSTYISFLPIRKFYYYIKDNKNNTGSFTEFLKNKNFGQISTLSVNPNCTRGNHYHHSKVEKFFIVKGKAKFQFQNLITKKKLNIIASSKKPMIVETIPGYTHNIKNIGKSVLIAIMWSNQTFNKNKPDTVYKKISND